LEGRDESSTCTEQKVNEINDQLENDGVRSMMELSGNQMWQNFEQATLKTGS